MKKTPCGSSVFKTKAADSFFTKIVLMFAAKNVSRFLLIH